MEMAVVVNWVWAVLHSLIKWAAVLVDNGDPHRLVGGWDVDRGSGRGMEVLMLR